MIVNTFGKTLKERAYHSAWQRFINGAIEAGVIDKKDRFSLHDLKRKGITDTQGGDEEKMNAGGHKSRKMLGIYDKSTPVVSPTSD